LAVSQVGVRWGSEYELVLILDSHEQFCRRVIEQEPLAVLLTLALGTPMVLGCSATPLLSNAVGVEALAPDPDLYVHQLGWRPWHPTMTYMYISWGGGPGTRP
jgi:hypothetical protein